MNIENKKQFAIILLAISLGGIATAGASWYIQKGITTETRKLSDNYQKKETMLRNEIEVMHQQLKTVTARQEALSKIQEQQKQWQAQQLKDLKDGKIALSATEQTRQETSPVVQMNSFAVRTPPGKRAMTILIDALSAVGGLVYPGDYVDIIAKLDIPESIDSPEKKRAVTSVLFQNVQVLAVGTNFKPIDTEAPNYNAQQSARQLNITLALTPEESGLLAFAKENGKLQLALRGPAEQETQTLQVASWEELSDFVLEHQGTDLFVPSAPAPELPAIRASKDSEINEVQSFIQIYRGGRRDL